MREVLTILRAALASGEYREASKFTNRKDLRITFTQTLHLLELPVNTSDPYDNLRPFTDKLDIMSNYKQEVDIATIHSYSKNADFVEMRLL